MARGCIAPTIGTLQKQNSAPVALAESSDGTIPQLPHFDVSTWVVGYFETQAHLRLRKNGNIK
jgi:hypothetical protein